MMLGLDQAAGFLAAAVLITLSPGPDNLMVLSLGIARGARKGMAFGIGCAAGCLSHTALAALGISAAIAASPSAFLALKVAGGLYLIWLGVQALRSTGGISVGADAAGNRSESAASLFAKGMIANAINPKVILFFLAFLPQFVDVDRGDVAAQTVQFGLIFTVQSALIFGAIGRFAGGLGRWLGRVPKAGTWLDRAAGSIFILLGLRLMAVQ